MIFQHYVNGALALHYTCAQLPNATSEQAQFLDNLLMNQKGDAEIRE